MVVPVTEDVNNGTSHLLQMQKGAVTLGHSVAVFCKTKHGFQYNPAVTLVGVCSSYLKSYVHTKSACECCGSFVPNHQKLEAIRYF